MINQSLRNGFAFNCGPFLPDLKSMSVECPRSDLLSEHAPMINCKFAKLPNYGNIFTSGSDEGGLITDCTFRSQYNKTWNYTLAHPHSTFDLSWSEVEMCLATSASDRRVRMWNVNEASDSNLIRTYEDHIRTARSAVFKPNDISVVVSGGKNGIINLWDVRNSISRPDRQITSPAERKSKCGAGQQPDVMSMFLNDYNALSTTDRTIYIDFWDLRKITHPVSTHSFACGLPGITDILNRNTSKVLFSTYNRNIYRYVIKNNMNLVEGTIDTGHIVSSFFVSLALSSDEKYLSCVRSTERVHIWPMDMDINSDIIRPYLQITSNNLINDSIDWYSAYLKTFITSDHTSPEAWSESKDPYYNRDNTIIETYYPPDHAMMLCSVSSAKETKRRKPIFIAEKTDSVKTVFGTRLPLKKNISQSVSQSVPRTVVDTNAQSTTPSTLAFQESSSNYSLRKNNDGRRLEAHWDGVENFPIADDAPIVKNDVPRNMENYEMGYVEDRSLDMEEGVRRCMDDSAPRCMEGDVPGYSEENTPGGNDQLEYMEDGTQRYVEEYAPGNMEGCSPGYIEDGGPGHMADSAPEYMEDVALRYEDDVPRYIQNGAPGYMEGGAQGFIRYVQYTPVYMPYTSGFILGSAPSYVESGTPVYIRGDETGYSEGDTANYTGVESDYTGGNMPAYTVENEPGYIENNASGYMEVYTPGYILNQAVTLMEINPPEYVQNGVPAYLGTDGFLYVGSGNTNESHYSWNTTTLEDAGVFNATNMPENTIENSPDCQSQISVVVNQETDDSELTENIMQKNTSHLINDNEKNKSQSASDSEKNTSQRTNNFVQKNTSQMTIDSVQKNTSQLTDNSQQKNSMHKNIRQATIDNELNTSQLTVLSTHKNSSQLINDSELKNSSLLTNHTDQENTNQSTVDGAQNSTNCAQLNTNRLSFDVSGFRINIHQSANRLSCNTQTNTNLMAMELMDNLQISISLLPDLLLENGEINTDPVLIQFTDIVQINLNELGNGTQTNNNLLAGELTDTDLPTNEEMLNVKKYCDQPSSELNGSVEVNTDSSTNILECKGTIVNIELQTDSLESVNSKPENTEDKIVTSKLKNSTINVPKRRRARKRKNAKKKQ